MEKNEGHLLWVFAIAVNAFFSHAVFDPTISLLPCMEGVKIWEAEELSFDSNEGGGEIHVAGDNMFLQKYKLLYGLPTPRMSHP